jgi:tetratricopeptide (TPR) repeat protein
VLREGAGEACGASDLVVLHLSLRCEPQASASLDSGVGQLLSSNRSSEGGDGVPLCVPLGDGCPMLRGLELALAACRVGERAVLRIPPAFAYGHECCAERGLRPPRGVDGRHTLLAELELLARHPAKVLRSASDGGLVAKQVLAEGRGLETPLAPYEVTLLAQCSLPQRWEGAAQPQAPPALPQRRLQLTLGAGQAPRSLELAVGSMRVGELARVWMHNTGDAPAAPFSALPELPLSMPHGCEWLVTLESCVQVRDLYGDGSLLKRRLAEGEGTFPVDCPIMDCTVRVQAACRALRDAPEQAEEWGEETLLEFELGLGLQPPGLEACLRLMVPGELARVSAAARHAYEASPASLCARPQSLPPPPCAVEWRLRLLSFQRPLNWHAASCEEALDDAERSKAAGLCLFQQGAWALAQARFHSVAAKLAGLRGLEEGEEARCLALRVACLLNQAACCQRLGEHAQAAQLCSQVLLKLDAGCAKALYRRAVSRIALGIWAEAREDLAAAAEADPEAEPDCRRQLARLAQQERLAQKQDKAKLGGFLEQ